MKRMKQTLIAAALGCAFSLTSAGLASAQSAGTTPGSGTAATPQSQMPAQSESRHLRASEVIGAKVRNPQGEDLGKIEDLVMDANGNRMRYAVLSHGGFLNIGDKLFAYPVEAFSLGREGRELVLDVPRERLKDAPGFDKDRWPDFNEAGYRGQVDRHHGARGERMVRVSELLGSDVKARAGDDDAGKLKDIVFTLGDSRVRYAVVDVDRGWRRSDTTTTGSAGTAPMSGGTAPATGTADTTATTGSAGTAATTGSASPGTTAGSDTATATGSADSATTTGSADSATTTGSADSATTTGSAGTTATTGTAGSTSTDPARPADRRDAGNTPAPDTMAGTPPRDPARGLDPATARTAPQDRSAARDRGDLHAVPLSALQWTGEDRDRIVLDMEPSQLPAERGFDERRLDNLNDPSFRREVEQQIGTTR